MPILTDSQQTECSRTLARKMYVEPNAVATRDTVALKTLVARIDAAMSATTTQAAALYSGVSLEVAFFRHIQAAVPDVTVAEAALALALWAQKRAGLA